jgi:tetratricopeptide (TPR) repeat protein
LADRSNLFAATTVAMARAGYIHDALNTIEAMESSPAKAQAYIEIAKAQGAAQQIGPANQSLSRAMGIASLIRDPGARAKVLASVAEAQSRMGRISDAMTTLARAKSSLEELPPSDPKTDALLILCGAQARLGDYSAAYATASPLKASPARADEAARAIVCAQADADQIAQAQAGLANIKLPQEQSLAREHLVMAQIRAGKLDDAAATADGIETPAPRGRAYAAICEAFSHAGNASKASSAMESAVSNLGVGDQAHRWELYPAIARVQAAIGKLADARATADQIEELPTKASAWCLIAAEQSRAGDPSGATKSLQSAATLIASASGAHRVAALAQIAMAQVQLNDPASANATLDLARTAATASANAREDDRALIEAQAQAGAWDAIEGSAGGNAAARCRALIAAAEAISSPLLIANAH